MNNKEFTIRFAKESDIPTILRFIKELAVYEHLEHELNLTEESLKENIFEKKKVEVVIAFEDNIPVGHAVFFETFSTFVGRHGLYLDDLYVNAAKAAQACATWACPRIAECSLLYAKLPVYL